MNYNGKLKTANFPFPLSPFIFIFIIYQNCSYQPIQKNSLFNIIIKLSMNPNLNLSNFIQQHKAHLTHQAINAPLSSIQATILPQNQQFLPIAAQLIQNGQLVAFPTQTVYGLGADATCEKALLDIYKVKKRPLTDPIIVHVLGYDDALKLVQVQSEEEEKIFKSLAQNFWPGPLTMILKANLEILPKVVTAQTGFVGIRSPKNPYARQLLAQSKRPIGAPSANLFSHVSPTSPVHVFNDFYDQKVSIINGDRCEYGIQSTVIKIINNRIEVLREGSLSTQKLSSFIKQTFNEKVKIEVITKVKNKKTQQNMESPGQMLKHYAPYLPCYFTTKVDLSQVKKLQDLGGKDPLYMKQTAFISFSKHYNEYKEKFKYYLQVGGDRTEEEDIFCSGEEKSRMKEVYYLLRKCENLDVKCILIGWNEAKSGTIWDKIFRSTQGQEAVLF